MRGHPHLKVGVSILGSSRLKAEPPHAGIAFRDAEVPVVLGLGILMFDIALARVVRDVVRRTGEVPAAPQMPAPELPIDPAEVHHEVVASLSLHGLPDAARRFAGRETQHQMDMVRPDVPLQDQRILGLADLPDQFAAPLSDLALQYRLAVLCGKDEMVMSR